jgi:UDP:flavonoid glycosyltransferase YjiC (YdhE family)
MGTESKPLKIYMLPFFAQGHLIPLVNLARLVASKNQQVTIITTPSNAQLFDKIIEEEKAAGHHIRVHIINFPATQVGPYYQFLLSQKSTSMFLQWERDMCGC